jgi:hypothetical protein
MSFKVEGSCNDQEERRANMYEDILKGKWKEIKGEVKVKWGKLTDEPAGRRPVIMRYS